MRNNMAMAVVCMALTLMGFCVGLIMQPGDGAFYMGFILLLIGFFGGLFASRGTL